MVVLPQLIQDNPNQQRRLVELAPLVQQRISQLQRLVNRETQVRLTLEGKQLQDQIQRLLAAMTAEEKALLAQRSQAVEASVRQIIWMVGVGFCLSFGLLIAVYWQLKWENYRRRQIEQALQQTNEQLELRVEERTAELTQANAFLREEIFKSQRTEEQVREQAALLNIATDAILVRSLESQILFWNQGAERMYGWAAAEVLGKSVYELLYPDPAAPEVTKALQTVLQTGEWQGELLKCTKAGETIVAECRWTLVSDPQGLPKSILTVDTDVTQKRQLEAQLLRTQRLENLGTLAGGIAHDLGNVLTPILAVAQLLPLKLPALSEQ